MTFFTLLTYELPGEHFIMWFMIEVAVSWISGFFFKVMVVLRNLL